MQTYHGERAVGRKIQHEAVGVHSLRPIPYVRAGVEAVANPAVRRRAEEAVDIGVDALQRWRVDEGGSEWVSELVDE